MAQGYWMPFQCAKAVCATFCHNIAGALIPIFGPDFPSLCTPSEAPEYSRMVINPEIVQRCTADAEHYRRIYSNSVTSSAGGRPSPPRDRRPLFRSPYDDPKHLNNHHRHHPIRKTLVNHAGYDSPYATDTDSEPSPVAAERGGMGSRDRFFFPPIPPPPPPPAPVAAPLRPATSGWTPANVVSPHLYDASGPSPWLSAVPRFTTTDHLPPYQPSPRHQHQNQHQHHPHHHHYHHSRSHPQRQPWQRGGKRSAEQVEADEYECDSDNRIGDKSSSSNNGAATKTGSLTPTSPTSPTTITTATTTATATPREGGSRSNSKPPGGGVGDVPPPPLPPPATILGADKNAALLLMNLSVRDPRGIRSKVATAGGTGVASETSSPCDATFPRIKRVRANSM